LRVITILLAFIFLAGGGAGLVLVAGGLLSGLNVTAPAGKLWFTLDAPSLNAAQAAVERYLLPAIWHGLIMPLLQLPAIALAGGGLLIALTLFALVRHRANGKRRIFHR